MTVLKTNVQLHTLNYKAHSNILRCAHAYSADTYLSLTCFVHRRCGRRSLRAMSRLVKGFSVPLRNRRERNPNLFPAVALPLVNLPLGIRRAPHPEVPPRTTRFEDRSSEVSVWSRGPSCFWDLSLNDGKSPRSRSSNNCSSWPVSSTRFPAGRNLRQPAVPQRQSRPPELEPFHGTRTAPEDPHRWSTWGPPKTAHGDHTRPSTLGHEFGPRRGPHSIPRPLLPTPPRPTNTHSVCIRPRSHSSHAYPPDPACLLHPAATSTPGSGPIDNLYRLLGQAWSLSGSRRLHRTSSGESKPRPF